MNWTPYLIVWICLGVATLGLALYRKFLTMKEDDYIHVEDWKAGEVASKKLPHASSTLSTGGAKRSPF